MYLEKTQKTRSLRLAPAHVYERDGPNPVFLHQQVPADAPLFAAGEVTFAPTNSIDGAIIGNN